MIPNPVDNPEFWMLNAPFFILLLLLSICSLGLMVEKLLLLRHWRWRSHKLPTQISQWLKQDRLEQLSLLLETEYGPEAILMRKSFHFIKHEVSNEISYEDNPDTFGTQGTGETLFVLKAAPTIYQIHRLEQWLEISIEELGQQLEKHCNLFHLIANVATLLGLLGTVTGMIYAFQNGVLEQSTQLAQGISQALVTTAGGLIVAIPAIVGQQLFLNSSATRISILEQLGHDILLFMHRRAARHLPESPRLNSQNHSPSHSQSGQSYEAQYHNAVLAHPKEQRKTGQSAIIPNSQHTPALKRNSQRNLKSHELHFVSIDSVGHLAIPQAALSQAKTAEPQNDAVHLSNNLPSNDKVIKAKQISQHQLHEEEGTPEIMLQTTNPEEDYDAAAIAPPKPRGNSFTVRIAELQREREQARTVQRERARNSGVSYPNTLNALNELGTLHAENNLATDLESGLVSVPISLEIKSNSNRMAIGNEAGSRTTQDNVNSGNTNSSMDEPLLEEIYTEERDLATLRSSAKLHTGMSHYSAAAENQTDAPSTANPKAEAQYTAQEAQELHLFSKLDALHFPETPPEDLEEGQGELPPKNN